MIKGIARRDDGAPKYFFGLSHRNLDLLREGRPIFFDLRALQEKGELLIWAAKDEEALMAQIREVGVQDAQTQEQVKYTHGAPAVLEEANVVEARKALATAQAAWAGQYPHGKCAHDDKGGLAVAIFTVANGDVRLEFGCDTRWMQLPPQDAERLALRLLQTAGKALGDLTVVDRRWQEILEKVAPEVGREP